MKAEEFDQKFDDGEDVMEYLDLDSATRPGLEPERIDIEFPRWMLEGLDREARKMRMDRNSIIKFWIAERLRNA